MSTGTITSADDGTQVFEYTVQQGPIVIAVLGGTTIDAQLRKTTNGTKTSVGTDGAIAADFYKEIAACPGDVFDIDVTTATGTWQVSISELLNR